MSDPQLDTLDQALQWVIDAAPPDEDPRWEQGRRVKYVLEMYGPRDRKGIVSALKQTLACQERHLQYLCLVGEIFAPEERRAEWNWGWHKVVVETAGVCGDKPLRLADVCGDCNGVKIKWLGRLARQKGWTCEQAYDAFGLLTTVQLTEMATGAKVVLTRCPHGEPHPIEEM